MTTTNDGVALLAEFKEMAQTAQGGSGLDLDVLEPILVALDFTQQSAMLGMLGQMLGAYEVAQDKAAHFTKQCTTVQKKLLIALVQLADAKQHDQGITKKHAEMYWALNDLMASVRSGRFDQIAASLAQSDQVLAR